MEWKGLSREEHGAWGAMEKRGGERKGKRHEKPHGAYCLTTRRTGRRAAYVPWGERAECCGLEEEVGTGHGRGKQLNHN